MEATTSNIRALLRISPPRSNFQTLAVAPERAAGTFEIPVQISKGHRALARLVRDSCRKFRR